MIKIAVQKSGRLSEKSIDLLNRCGIKVNSKGSLKAKASNFDLEVLYLRDDDIPKYVAEGIADLGIVGENVLQETGLDLKTILPLGFGKCRLSLALPREWDYSGINDFQGKRIATSYPKILKQFLDGKGIAVEIEEISGSVEIAPSIGLADGICDLVSSGSTLLKNGLKEVEVLMQSESVLIGQKETQADKQALIDDLLFRIQSVLRATQFKYILLNAPNDKIEAISKLLPGMKSPTVLPLSETGWSSLHSVVKEEEFWPIINQLKNEGAEGILVCPIEKMIL